MKNKLFMLGMVAVLLVAAVSCEEGSASFGQAKNNFSGPEIGEWKQEVVTMNATPGGESPFKSEYQIYEFLPDGTLFIRDYEGGKMTRERRGTYNPVNTTYTIEGRYHGDAYYIDGIRMYPSAFDARNNKVTFHTLKKVGY
jgi:hypothetical protein